MKFYQNLTRVGLSSHSARQPDPGSGVVVETISREILKARRPDIIHGEAAYPIDALSRYGHGERRPDPDPGSPSS